MSEFFNPTTGQWQDIPEGHKNRVQDSAGKVYHAPKDARDADVTSEVEISKRKQPGFYKKYIAPATTAAVGELLSPAPGFAEPSPMGKWLAEQITPQTGTEAALTAVPFARVGKLGTGILGQMLKAGTTAGVSSSLEGEESPAMAATGATALTGTMESLVRGGGAIARNVIPGVRNWLAGRTGQKAVETLPTGAPMREAMDQAKGSRAVRLGKVGMGGEGQAAMSQRFEARLSEIGTTPVLDKLGNPTKAQIGEKQWLQSDALYDVWQNLPEKRIANWKGKRIDLSPDPRTGKFDIFQAQTLLKEARRQAPNLSRMEKVGITKEGLLDLAEEAEQHILGGLTKLNPKAATIFTTMNKEYASNAAMRDLMEHAVVPGGSKGPIVDIARAQQYMWENQRELRRRLGPEQFNQLWSTLGRGSNLGAMDRPGKIGGMVPWMNVSGSMKLTPPGGSLGATYAGEPPMRPGIATRAFLDALAARSGSQVGKE